MKCFVFLTLFFFGAIGQPLMYADDLPGRPGSIHSLRLTATMKGDFGDLTLVLLRKGRERMRASISDDGKEATVTLIYNRGTFAKIVDHHGKAAVTNTHPPGSGAQILDLLVLSHGMGDIREFIDAAENRRHFENLEIHLKHAADEDDSASRGTLDTVHLYDRTADSATLARMIEVEEYGSFGDAGRHPKVVSMTDRSSGETGTVVVRNVEINVGLPAFLFEMPSAPSEE